MHPVIVTAINHALTNNVVVIFATGNTANHANNQDGIVSFPANVDIAGVITVGASDRDDNQANYSPTNSLVDIVAPSHRAYPNQITGETFEMWSIDIPGNAGYNPWAGGVNPPVQGEELPDDGTNFQSYTGRFGGTSHSCPVVAGVAALLLSINPEFSYMDVFEILTNTADKVGGFTYTSGHCNEMGFGRVNAFNAVTEAIDRITVTGTSIVCYSGSTFTASHAPLGSSISWHTSSNLSVLSGGNTLTPTIGAINTSVSGIDTIQILFTLNGNITEGPELEVWTGKPGVPVTNPSGYPTIELMYGGMLNVSLSETPGANATSGNWWSSGSIENLNSTGSSCMFEATENGWGNFYVTTTNICDTSAVGGGSVNVNGGGPLDPMLIAFPNPAKEYFEIQLDESIAFSNNTEVESVIRIYDQHFNLKKTRKFKGKKLKVYSNKLSKGLYLVEVVNKYGNYSTKVIINKD